MNHSLEGRWQPLFAELDGEEAPVEVLQQTEVELSDGRYYVRFGHLTADQGQEVRTRPLRPPPCSFNRRRPGRRRKRVAPLEPGPCPCRAPPGDW